MASQGVREGPVEDLFAAIARGVYPNVHSVILVRNGKLVAERYFAGRDGAGRSVAFDAATPHEAHSVTKSVTSILIGIAIDERLIRGDDVPLISFFPEVSEALGSDKRRITLEHALTMTTGLAWDEWKYPYDDPRNDHAAMNASGDPVGFVLRRPLAATPGATFAYNDGVSIVLGDAIRRASGVRTDSFATAHLFSPLGITIYRWWTYPDGTVQAGSGLSLRPRDMAKLGQLMLDNGRWRGRQVVSEAWVGESERMRVRHPPEGFPWWMRSGVWLFRATGRWAPAPEGYAYQWWTRSFTVGGRVVRTFSAEGRGGQFIFVIPDLNAVAVFTGWNDDITWNRPVLMLERHILPALLHAR